MCEPIRRPACHKILSCQMYNLVVCVCFRLLIGLNLATSLLIGTVQIVRDLKLVSNSCQIRVKLVSNLLQSLVETDRQYE